MESSTTRRQTLAGFAGLMTLALVGCSRPTPGGTAADRMSTSNGPSTGATSMIVYRDPGCGCCEEWAARARDVGYRVVVNDDSDMPAIKRKFGVPDQLVSCHTTIAAGYVIEGHVPLADVRRLLASRPPNVKGIAVPGMPIGSPGMEAPDGVTQPFEVMAFDAAGLVTPFKV